jgi:hypothetical protein
MGECAKEAEGVNGSQRRALLEKPNGSAQSEDRSHYAGRNSDAKNPR